MHRFGAALRRAARELDLPPRVRAAILLELAADLEAAYEDHRARGAGESEAVRLAEERVLGSPAMIRRLARLHAEAGGGGWFEGLGARLREGTGRVLVLVAVVPLLLVGAWVGISGALEPPVSPLLWVLLPVGAALAGVVLREGARLARGGMPPAGSLALLAFLSMAAPAVGLLTAGSGLYAIAVALSGTGAPTPDMVALAERAARDGALLVLGLLLGIAGGLSWFVLAEGAAARAEREADALLEEGPGSPPGESPDVIPLVRRRKA